MVTNDSADAEAGAADLDGDAEVKAAWTWGETIIAFLWLAVFIVCVSVLFWYGPTAVLVWVFDVVPRKPGWDWFFGICILLTFSIIFMLPLTMPLLLFAGFLFGLWFGWLHNFLALYIGSCVSMAIGRMFLKDKIRGWLTDGDNEKIKIMLAILEDKEDSMKLMCLFRFLLVPLFIKNYAPATLDVPLWKLFVAAIPHCLWIALITASIGASFKSTAELLKDGKDDEGETHWQNYAVMAVALTTTVIISVYAYTKYNEKVEAYETRPIAGAPPVPAR